jgi:hypothetical protein
MRRYVPAGLALAFGSCLAIASAARAADETPPPTTPGTAPACVHARDLMTPAEMQDFRTKMHAAMTQAERAQAAQAFHATAQARASKKGQSLCPEGHHRHGGPGGMGPGMGPGMGRGPGIDEPPTPPTTP